MQKRSRTLRYRWSARATPSSRSSFTGRKVEPNCRSASRRGRSSTTSARRKGIATGSATSSAWRVCGAKLWAQSRLRRFERDPTHFPPAKSAVLAGCATPGAGRFERDPTHSRRQKAWFLPAAQRRVPGALSETLHISRRQKAWFLPAAQRRVPGALSETLYISHRQKAWFLPAAQRRVP